MAKEIGIIPAPSGACRTLYNHLLTLPLQRASDRLWDHKSLKKKKKKNVEGTATKLLQWLLLQCDSSHRTLAEEHGTTDRCRAETGPASGDEEYVEEGLAIS